MSTPRLLTTARRKDRRADDPVWLRHFLTRAPVGSVAFLAHGRPLLNSNLFVYDPAAHAIYLHTARRGTTRDGAEEASPACFQAFSMGRILPAERALDFSVEYESVAAFGTLKVVEDATEAFHALALLMAKYAPRLAPGDDYEAATQEDLRRTSVMCLTIESWSGKRNLKPERLDGYTYAAAGDGSVPESAAGSTPASTARAEPTDGA